MLSHHPDTVEDLRHFKIDLILSGHTHGGTSCVPSPIAAFVSAFVKHPVKIWAWSYGSHLITPTSTTPTTLTTTPTTPTTTTSSLPSTLLYTTSGLAAFPPRYLCKQEVVIFTLKKGN